MSRVSEFSLQRIQNLNKKKKKNLFFLNFFGMGVGGGGRGGGTSESDFFNKESKSTKNNFCPFF